jgi:hypothetical protein
LTSVGDPVISLAGVSHLSSVEFDCFEDTRVGGEGDGEFGAVTEGISSPSTSTPGAKTYSKACTTGSDGARFGKSGGGIFGLHRHLNSSGLDLVGGRASTGFEGDVGVRAGDDSIGECLEGVLHLVSSGGGRGGVDGLGCVFLAKDVVENDLERATNITLPVPGAEVDDGSLVDAAVDLVVIERVDAILALLERAISAVVHRITLAAHGLVLVPEIIGVRLLDGEVKIVVSNLVRVYTHVAGGVNGTRTGSLQTIKGDGTTYTTAVRVSTLFGACCGPNRCSGWYVFSIGVVALQFGELLDGFTGAVAAAIVGA